MTTDNDEQIAYWNSDAGARWASLQGRIDAVFGPLTEAAIARASIAAGEAVLDVGCGSGATSLECARLVGEKGRVVGIDVSQPMLKLAGRRRRMGDFTQLDFVEADASTYAFDGSFDVLVSRFGVMFFADPAAAFTNLRTALRPGGRLMFACWQRISANPWFLVPVVAVREIIPADPTQPPVDPHAPGPFAFSDPERVRAILTSAGFTDIEIEPHTTSMRLAGPGDVDSAADFTTQIGPVSRLLHDAPDDERAQATAAIHTALAKHDSPAGIVLGGAIWIVRGRS